MNMPLSESMLMLMAMLAIGVLVSGLFRKLPIPYTVMLVLIGMLLGNLATVWAPLAPIQQLHLSPELVFFIFLPVLIFDSGFSLDARQLAKDLVPVLMLAVPALLVSTTIVGLGIWLLLPLELPTALLFGALISATDPVAVVAMFKELGTPLRLLTLVEGESLFNDATAIVVFSILLGLATAGGFAASDVPLALIRFLEVFLGGVLVGLGFGLLCSWAAVRLHLEISVVLISSLILAYASFIVAEHSLHVSGVMAVVAAAVSFSVIAVPRLHKGSGKALHETWEFLANIANTLLFLLIGMTVNLHQLLNIVGPILIAAVLVILARACVVYSFVPLTVSRFRLPRVSIGERHIMTWGGLKGGLAIAIALSIPVDFPNRELLLNLTLGVVLFSLLINAPTIRPLIAWLGLDQLSVEEKVELKQASTVIRRRTDLVLNRLLQHQVLSRAGVFQAEREIDQRLQWSELEASDEYLARQLWFEALREESRELERLYSAGIIPQYVFLDVRSELQRKRDHLRNPERPNTERWVRQWGIFQRFENQMVRKLRELDWASGLLASYQNLRISQHILKDIVRIMMAEAALDYLNGVEVETQEAAPAICKQYRRRLGMLHDNIAAHQVDYPDFYQRFESHLARKAALVSVLRDVAEERQKGSISAKVFVVMDHAVNTALDDIPAVSSEHATLGKEDLIQLVPLFSDISRDIVMAIADKSTTVNFLSNDIVIGQGEHGNALYIIARGRVRVSLSDGEEQKELAELGPGDVFGELALLGDEVRQATVTAIQACTMLRVSASSVRQIAADIPELGDYMEKLKQERLAELGTLQGD